MTRPRDDASERVRPARNAVVVMLAGLLALVLPTLLSSGADPVGVVAQAVVALAVVALVHSGRCRVALTGGTPLPPPLAGHRVAPELTGRVTDPVHHPLRPRAPGLT